MLTFSDVGKTDGPKKRRRISRPDSGLVTIPTRSSGRDFIGGIRGDQRRSEQRTKESKGGKSKANRDGNGCAIEGGSSGAPDRRRSVPLLRCSPGKTTRWAKLTVKNGVLHGELGTRGAPAFFEINGKRAAVLAFPAVLRLDCVHGSSFLPDLIGFIDKREKRKRLRVKEWNPESDLIGERLTTGGRAVQAFALGRSRWTEF